MSRIRSYHLMSPAFFTSSPESLRAARSSSIEISDRIPYFGGISVKWESQITANLRTKILDFRGFDSSIILILRGGILMSMGNSPEIMSQQILVGIILVGRLAVSQDQARPVSAQGTRFSSAPLSWEERFLVRKPVQLERVIFRCYS